MKRWVTKSGQKIYQVLEGRSNSFLISYNGKHLLVDTGREDSWESLCKALDQLRVSNHSLVALILTHSHFDHAENAAHIKEKFETKIILHKDEADYLRRGENPLICGTNFVVKFFTDLFAEKVLSRRHYQPADFDILVDEKFDLSDLGFNAYLIHTPGHSPGSMSMIIDNEIALVGDAMFGIFKGSAMPPFADNVKILVKSWEKLLATGCSVFLPGHGKARGKELLQRQYEKYKRKYLYSGLIFLDRPIPFSYIQPVIQGDSISHFIDKEGTMMKRRHLIWIGRIGIIGFVFLSLFACAGMKPEPAGFIAPGAVWQEVSREGMAFGEGVVAAPNGIIYFSSMTRTIPPGPDNPGGTIFRFDPATGKTTKYLEPSGMSNGLHIDRNGDLLIAQDSGGGGKGGGRAIMRRNLATGAMSVVADNYQGKHFNGPNDLTADSKGRVYFTDARYGGTEPMELPNAVYRVDLDGKVTQLSTDILRPNGIEVSPDGKRLYVAASNAKHLPANPNGPAVDKFGMTMGGVVAYDLDSKGNISNGRLFFRNDVLLVDGMTMDRQGNLYLAMHNGNGNAPDRAVMVLNPEGQIVERIPTPEAGLTTNLGFGRGADAGSLYVTTAFPIRLYRIKTVREGHYF